jgi:RimJ/RimL family protein N-acetyltransferase
VGEPHVVTLRATRAGDLDELFRFRQDPEANRMAAFTSGDRHDREAFDTRWDHLITDPEVDVRTIRADGIIVGDLVRWSENGATFIGYWIDTAHWGEGIATRALRLFVDAVHDRPLLAHVAADNAGSIRVLEKLGFVQAGNAVSYANARGIDIEERIYRLD